MTRPAEFPPREYVNLKNLVEANDILHSYTQPHSDVDIGNVFYAAHVFRDELIKCESLLREKEKEVEKLREALLFYADVGNYICANPKLKKFNLSGITLVTADNGVLEDQGNRARQALAAGE